MKLDYANVYFRDGIGGGVWREPRTGGEPQLLASSNGFANEEIDANSGVVYWNSFDGIWKVNADGTGVQRIDTGGKN